MKKLKIILITVLFAINPVLAKDKGSIEIIELEGWKGSKDVESLEVKKKVLRFKSVGKDPYLIAPPFYDYITGPVKVHIRMKLSSEMNNKAYLYFLTENEPLWNSSRTVNFTTLPDGEFYTYEIEINTNDPILQIRIDPSNSMGNGEIEWVKIERIM
jgi:hypothetical protein